MRGVPEQERPPLAPHPARRQHVHGERHPLFAPLDGLLQADQPAAAEPPQEVRLQRLPVRARLPPPPAVPPLLPRLRLRHHRRQVQPLARGLEEGDEQRAQLRRHERRHVDRRRPVRRRDARVPRCCDGDEAVRRRAARVRLGAPRVDESAAHEGVDPVAPEEEVALEGFFGGRGGGGVGEVDDDAAVGRARVPALLDAAYLHPEPQLDGPVRNRAGGLHQGLDQVLAQHADGVDVGPQAAERRAGAVREHLDVRDARRARAQARAGAERVEVAQRQRRQVDGAAQRLDGRAQLEDGHPDRGGGCRLLVEGQGRREAGWPCAHDDGVQAGHSGGNRGFSYFDSGGFVKVQLLAW